MYTTRWRHRVRAAGPMLAGWSLLIVGVAIAIVGSLLVNGWDPLGTTSNFYVDVSTTLIGTAIVVLIIDRLYRARALDDRRAGLVRDMASSDNGLALRAVSELRVAGSLTDGFLDGQNFSRANLEGGRLEGFRARGGRLQGCRIAGANLAAAQLEGAVLNSADLSRCNLEMASMDGASLIEASLSEADLGGARLRKALLSGARLEGADLRDADLRDARLEGADLTAVQIIGALIGGAVIDGSTRLPAGSPPAKQISDGLWSWPTDTVWL